MFTHCHISLIFLDKLAHAYFLFAIDLASGYHQVHFAKDA